jgi:CheY-like chemotaxis protein
MTTILFTDDNPAICEYCRRGLEDDGYDVLIAHNGAEAVRMARVRHPDLVVLDICMPGMDGLEAAPHIRRVLPAVPIVFFTLWDEACAEHEHARFASACVEKSEDLTELKRVIAAVLWARRQRRPYHLGLPPLAHVDARSGATRDPSPGMARRMASPH